MTVAAVAQIAPQNLDAERSILGAVMVTDVLGAVLTETHLRPEHFYRDRHQHVFRAILALHERGQVVDSLTVTDELGKRGLLDKVGGRDEVQGLPDSVRAPANAPHYARLVVEKAQWRRRGQAAPLIREAAETEDTSKLAEAEDLLREDLLHPNSDYAEDRLADVAYELMEGQARGEFPFPFEKLNRLTEGGMLRGDFTVLSGYSGFGKSQFLDQILDTASKHGKRAWLYMNEMTVRRRVARRITRWTGIPFSRVVAGKLDAVDHKKVLDLLNRGMGWGMSAIHGWSAEEVCHHIRATRPDVAAIDLLNRFEWQDERELSRMVTLFDQTADLAGCALILVCQLNERAPGAARASRRAVFPPPVYTDLKGSGDIKNHADHVLFVHREQDPETGDPLADGAIYFGKIRDGGRGGPRVTFNEHRLRFELAA